jgi:hypothetical protein
MKLRSLLIFNFILTVSLHVNANNASELPTAEINNMSCGSTSALASNGKRLYLPEDGYVPNEEVAIKIAVAVWTPIYGAKKIAQEKPYKAKLKQDIWHVTGSLRDGLKGGAAEMYLCKYNAKILGVTHGK